MSKHHTIKCVQPYFDEVKSGRKPFEMRFNDREYEQGDTVTLRLYDPENPNYLSFDINGTIGYVLTEFEGLKKGWCVFGLQNTELISHF